jgi:hypothetical protein
MVPRNNKLFRTILITLTTLILSSGPALAAATINGAGATFPLPGLRAVGLAIQQRDRRQIKLPVDRFGRRNSVNSRKRLKPSALLLTC